MTLQMLRLPALLLALSPFSLAQTIVYVDANLTTGLNDGSSWANAHQGPDGLQTALTAAVAGDRVFAARGTYLPSSTGSRFVSFRLKVDVEVYGSFLGGEATPEERPPFGTAPSILSGDLLGDDPAGLNDNSYHVVHGNFTNASAVLDGFSVIGGNGNGTGTNDKGGGILCVSNSSPTLRNCRFTGNRCTFGGGAGYINASVPSFTDCSFEDNVGGAFGGAFDIATAGAVRFERCLFAGNRAARAGALEIFATSGVVVGNCVFRDNTATGSSGGGAIWIGNGGSTSILDCTVVANTSTVSSAAGLRVQGSTTTVANGIFWGNTGPGGAHSTINQITGTSNVTYSIVEGGIAGTGNLASDPQFEDIGAGNFALLIGSPAIDAGNNASVPAGATLDFAAKPRFLDEPSVPDTGAGSAPIVDIGAFEFQPAVGTSDPGCVPTANSTGSPSTLTASGSLVVAHNAVDLAAHSLPLGQFGYFLMSESSVSMPVASGVLCLGSPQFRFNADILSSGAAGEMRFSPDFDDLPQGQVFGAGETWYFQLWYRDGGTSNFSGNLGFTWQ